MRFGAGAFSGEQGEARPALLIFLIRSAGNIREQQK
jgi:hypothetical protein